MREKIKFEINDGWLKIQPAQCLGIFAYHIAYSTSGAFTYILKKSQKVLEINSTFALLICITYHILNLFVAVNFTKSFHGSHQLSSSDAFALWIKCLEALSRFLNLKFV